MGRSFSSGGDAGRAQDNCYKWIIFQHDRAIRT
jgi:hypothetical protein